MLSTAIYRWWAAGRFPQDRAGRLDSPRVPGAAAVAIVVPAHSAQRPGSPAGAGAAEWRALERHRSSSVRPVRGRPSACPMLSRRIRMIASSVGLSARNLAVSPFAAYSA